MPPPRRSRRAARKERACRRVRGQCAGGAAHTRGARGGSPAGRRAPSATVSCPTRGPWRPCRPARAPPMPPPQPPPRRQPAPAPAPPAVVALSPRRSRTVTASHLVARRGTDPPGTPPRCAGGGLVGGLANGCLYSCPPETPSKGSLCSSSHKCHRSACRSAVAEVASANLRCGFRDVFGFSDLSAFLGLRCKWRFSERSLTVVVCGVLPSLVAFETS